MKADRPANLPAGLPAGMKPGEVPLETLLASVALGDRAAFGQLYERTSAKLFGVCLRILGDRGDAQEALHETYVRVWHKADRYSAGGGSAIAWLVAVARNQAIDRLRARKTPAGGPELAEALPDGRPSPEALAVTRDEHRRLEGCLQELEARRQAAIREAYFGGQTYETLARRADVPLGTMKSWIRRGLISLRQCLEA